MYLIGHRARPAGNLALQPRHRGLWSRWYAVALSDGRAASTALDAVRGFISHWLSQKCVLKQRGPRRISRSSAAIQHGWEAAMETRTQAARAQFLLPFFFFLHNKLTFKMIHCYDSERFVLTNAGEIYCCWLTATQTQPNLRNESTHAAVYGSNSTNATCHKLKSRRVERQMKGFGFCFFLAKTKIASFCTPQNKFFTSECNFEEKKNHLGRECCTEGSESIKMESKKKTLSAMLNGMDRTLYLINNLNIY